MPAEGVRAFGTWFFQRKRELLDYEIRRSGKHPAVWEKKGSSLYRPANLSRYRGLRKLTARLLARIERTGGDVFYAGIKKTSRPEAHDANALYLAMLRESTAGWTRVLPRGLRSAGALPAGARRTSAPRGTNA